MHEETFKDRVERLLREPENLFGPPTGQGYDYLRAGLIVVALALAALSGWCLFAPWSYPGLAPVLATMLLLVGAPFCIGGGVLWPVNLLVGWAGAVVVWYATLHTFACLTGLRRCGRLARLGWGAVALVGWAVGAGLALTR